MDIWENGRLAEDVAHELNASAPWITLGHSRMLYTISAHGRSRLAAASSSLGHAVATYDARRAGSFDDDIVWADCRRGWPSSSTRRETYGVHPVLYANTINNPLWAWARRSQERHDPKPAAAAGVATFPSA